MAVKSVLKKEIKENYYGFDFEEIYFKISNLRIDVSRDEIKIDVRGYASPEAREMEKKRENLEKLVRKDLLGNIKDLREKIKKKRETLKNSENDTVLENLKKELEKIEKEREVKEKELDETSRIVGIYKESFICTISDLKIEDFSVNGIKTAAYNYLKENIELLKGEDV